MGKANSKLSPEIVSDLQKTTHFDKKEIQSWYKAFLRECPSGSLTKDQFIIMFERFFPFGDPIPFAQLLFRLYNVSSTGSINFGEFLSALSITCRGRMEEKLQWAFKMYDLNGDGKVTKTEMVTVVETVYKMMGSLMMVDEEEDTAEKRVDKWLRSIGMEHLNPEEGLSLDEFREATQSDPLAVQALFVYDGVV